MGRRMFRVIDDHGFFRVRWQLVRHRDNPGGCWRRNAMHADGNRNGSKHRVRDVAWSKNISGVSGGIGRDHGRAVQAIPDYVLHLAVDGANRVYRHE